MKKFCNLMVDNMAVLVVLVSVVAVIWPWTLTWVGPWVAWMLGIVMFGMGMTLKFDDFRLLAKRPWEVFLGALAQFTIMPAVAWLLVKAFHLPPELAIGVVLVGTCPGGTASNVITYLAKGDVALSVAMTMTTTLLAPIVTPGLTWLLAGAWIDISLTAMMISIAQMVLAPVILGLLVNHFFGDTVKKCLPVLPLISVVCIVLLVGCVVALSSSKLLTHGLLIAGVVVCHNALGLACGYIFGRVFHLTPPKVRALAIEVGMQNSGLAASLAVLYFSPAAAIPGAIFSVWHNISGSIVANYCVRKDNSNTTAQIEPKAA
ncbi:MAG: bile acid:sodium symporter family protein [Schwartzia sp.]|nr:bile acid:sodium symporter family protein [Schwartzia sp. (in: firmicutes)]